MPKEPYLPLYVGDFLAATLYWRGEQRALYLLLLSYQWASGPLPSDLTELAQSVHFEPKQFAKLWKTIGKKFIQTKEGWVNSRLEEHRVRAAQISTGNRARAKHAAEQRWSSAPSNARSMLNGYSKHSSSIAGPDAIQSKPNEEEESEACQGEERRIPS